jgi:UDP-glucose-4-epimerase GalE
MNVLVTGGAGYIGSIAVRLLLKAGHDVTVLDNLSSGHRSAVTPPARLVVGDIGNESLLDKLLAEVRFDCVMHFAGLIRVPESVEKPGLYFDNNVGRGIVLLNAVCKHRIPRFVFSSTAAVYGSPRRVPITEDAPLQPTNPYGDTKRVFEELLASYGRACGLRFALLRYFNVAGAYDGLGEDHRPETHLIPLIIRAALEPGRTLEIYGDDYPTKDGTCVRDYIHVHDLVRAHLLAMDALSGSPANTQSPPPDPQPLVYNLGSQNGYTNREVFAAAEKVIGVSIPVRIAGRRAGDAPALIASAEKIGKELGWRPEKSLEDMIRDALEFHRRSPSGYPD